MDAFYEESAFGSKSEKEKKKYQIINVIFWICVVICVIFLMQCIMSVPWSLSSEADYTTLGFAIFCGIQALAFGVTAFVLYKWKSRLNVSYDYCFVSGELRISKVININKRKLITRIDCADMLQIGDVDNSGFERLYSDPNTKKIVCTSNDEPSNGKFFMYILVGNNGKELYVLECRELLLMNILKFARRGVLESDYVMQEKKQK